MTVEELTEDLYEFYRHEVAGVTLFGNVMPAWQDLKNDPERALHARAWQMTVARATQLLLVPQVVEQATAAKTQRLTK